MHQRCEVRYAGDFKEAVHESVLAIERLVCCGDGLGADHLRVHFF